MARAMTLMVRLSLTLVLVMSFASSAFVARAADFTVRTVARNSNQDEPAPCNIRLRGTIIARDEARLGAAIKKLGLKSTAQEMATLCLHSLGGSIAEGIKLIKAHQYQAVIGPGAVCASTCAFVFLAGQWCGKYTCEPSRYLHVSAHLGLHAPYLVVPAGRYSNRTVKLAYKIATNQIGQLLEIFSRPIGQGDQKGKAWGHIGIFTGMLIRGPGELYVIDTVGEVGLYNINLYGVAPTGRPTKRMLYNACVNVHNWSRNAAGEYDYLDRFADIDNGPKLNRVAFQIDNAASGVLTATLKQELHYVYDAWYECIVKVVGTKVDVSLDGLPAREFGTWAFFPGNAPISQLANKRYIQRMRAK